MNKRAISFITYNRFNYLLETLASWEKARGLENYDLHFFVEPSDNLTKMLKIIDSFSKRVSSPVVVTVNEIGKGNLGNSYNAINSIIDKYEFVILAEDDVIVSDDIIEYFDYLIPVYENTDVVTISANHIHETDLGDNAVYVRPEFSGLGWGTWPKHWHDKIKYAWFVDDLKPNDPGWDHTLNLIVYNYNLLGVFPAVSRSQHIGKTGQWVDPKVYETMFAKTFKSKNKFINPREYKEIPIDGVYGKWLWEERDI